MASLLLDTHALLWWLDGDARLPRRRRGASPTRRTTVFVSAATAWEITTKHRLGKLPDAAESRGTSRPASRRRFRELPIAVADGERAGRLPGPHRDPFDRMIVAQALGADLMLVSNEALFDGYGVRRLW